MAWIKKQWQFIAGLLSALFVLWLSFRANRNNAKSLHHKEVAETLSEMDKDIGIYGDEILQHNKKSARHAANAQAIKNTAKNKIKKIKEADNETINSLVDRWNTGG